MVTRRQRTKQAQARRVVERKGRDSSPVAKAEVGRSPYVVVENDGPPRLGKAVCVCWNHARRGREIRVRWREQLAFGTSNLAARKGRTVRKRYAAGGCAPWPSGRENGP